MSSVSGVQFSQFNLVLVGTIQLSAVALNLENNSVPEVQRQSFQAEQFSYKPRKARLNQSALRSFEPEQLS